MDELSWGNLDAAVWGLAVLALLFGFVGFGLWRRVRLARLGEAGPLPGLLDARGAGRLTLRAVLVLASTGLIVLGLMRPQHGTRAHEVKNMGIDIAVALDASRSMKVSDVVPSRFEAAKLEIRDLMEGLTGGRVGLVPFAGVAFVQTPLTSDFDVIDTYLEDLRIRDMPRQGTAIGRALTEAIRALVPAEKLEGTLAAHSEQDGEVDLPDDVELPAFEGSQYKAVVLFTDGEDHEGEAERVAKLASELGIRIFTVGVGTGQGRPVPVLNDAGEVVGTREGPDGTPRFSELDEPLMRRIADVTDGGYFHLGSKGLGSGLADAIDELEKKEYAATFEHLRDDRFQLALVPALLLLVLEALLGNRARRRRRAEAGSSGEAS